MSGGSFNYLARQYDVDGAAGVIAARQGDLLRMAHALESLCPEAAEETRVFVSGGTVGQRCRSLVDAADRHAQRLAPLWHAVEWFYSSDYGQDRVDEAVAAYRELGPPSEDSELHAGCYRPDRAVDLVYLRRAAGGVYHSWRVQDTAPSDLAGVTDAVGLRYLLASLEEAVDRVRDALHFRKTAGRADR